MLINTVSDLRKAMRETRCIYPGGYEFVFITQDGAELCRQCVKNEFRSIADSVSSKLMDGWWVIECHSTANDNAELITCDHCDKTLLDVRE